MSSILPMCEVAGCDFYRWDLIMWLYMSLFSYDLLLGVLCLQKWNRRVYKKFNYHSTKPCASSFNIMVCGFHEVVRVFKNALLDEDCVSLKTNSNVSVLHFFLLFLQLSVFQIYLNCKGPRYCDDTYDEKTHSFLFQNIWKKTYFFLDILFMIQILFQIQVLYTDFFVKLRNLDSWVGRYFILCTMKINWHMKMIPKNTKDKPRCTLPLQGEQKNHLWKRFWIV